MKDKIQNNGGIFIPPSTSKNLWRTEDNFSHYSPRSPYDFRCEITIPVIDVYGQTAPVHLVANKLLQRPFGVDNAYEAGYFCKRIAEELAEKIKEVATIGHKNR